VYGLGNKAELLVAVRQSEGPDGATAVQLTTDLPMPAVLHWGVRRGTSRSEWLRPPPEVSHDIEHVCVHVLVHVGVACECESVHVLVHVGVCLCLRV
jgi:hypothetical protein